MRLAAFLVPSLFLLAAHAQDLPGGARLGMSLSQLQQAVPAAAPVPRPQRLAGGLVGSWAGPPAEIGGAALTPTYYFAEGQLRRIEYLATSDAFDGVRAWARAQWGPELASQSPEGEYATWSAGDLDVYLQRTGGVRAVVRLVLKLRVAKDASEL